VQNEIAEAIIGEGLRIQLTAKQRRRAFAAPTDDAEAYELFLRAVHHVRLSTESDYLAARDLLAQAVERDPRFALAWVTLASTYSVMAIDGYEAPAETWPQSERYVARALAIDADLPDAHAEAAASAFYYRWNWSEAQRQWDLAFRLRSEVQSELLAAYALLKWASGQPQAALEIAHAARQVDPLSAQAPIREADLLAAVGRVDDAIRLYQRVIHDRPDDPSAHFGLAEAWRKQGRFDEALAARQRAHRAAGDESLDAVFAGARGAAGYAAVVRAAAQQEIERLTARRDAGGYVSPLDFARAHAQLGHAAQAFAYLSSALDERAAGLALLKVDPAWDGMRDDPRFAETVARVGLP
jgi:tetratricopeptide (TPR) repeat protein